MLKLNITQQAIKFFRLLPAMQYRQVFNKILALMEDPEAPDSFPLVGYPSRRADIGEYRIIYRVEEDCLKVALVGKRNDDEIYRQLKSQLLRTSVCKAFRSSANHPFFLKSAAIAWAPTSGFTSPNDS